VTLVDIHDQGDLNNSMNDLPHTIDAPTTGERLLSIFDKTRRRGIGWLLRRIKEEVSTPSTPATRALRNALAAVERSFIRRVKAPLRSDESDAVLYFFYDVEACPITYDAVSYLCDAEIERRQLGLEQIHVVVVPGRANGLREEQPDYEQAVAPEARRFRLHHLLIPLFRLLPSCTGYTVCATRQEAHTRWLLGAHHVFPRGYTVTFPVLPNMRGPCEAALRGETVFPMLQAPAQALAYVRQFLDARAAGRRVVVINLRRYGFMPTRNSTDANWVAFARGLDAARWLPVFVLDTDGAHDLRPDLEGFVIFHSAPWNIELRMALYELADLTMAIAQGPMELCWLNHRCRYAMFVRPNSSSHTTPRALREACGFEENQTPPYAVAGQRWVWTSDDLPVLRSVFQEITGDRA
jgi:hypothetical protein